MENSIDIVKVGIFVIIVAIGFTIFWKLGYIVGDLLGKAIYYISH